ncbi:Ig-like domain repeat protein [Edaphobacter albus]|uniref:Ig-like domain repeat protein n=1 Tax=Edaphobacter sp. 4G125 TaxID=2763071 RepID=UPI00164882F0|nr:Ig-like domain repeat protein [Edaphobacter sp. 4G125]QNI35312.1 Ig-like domain repeat protein [Edaphobacter sp. 4G125]
MDSLSIFPPRRRWGIWACVFLLLTLAGRAQNPAITHPLLLPSAIAFDNQGNLYVAETSNHMIRKIDRTGNISIVAGDGVQGYGGDGGAATSAQLDSPQGLAVDASNLYIADTHNHRIRRVNLSTGVISTIAGSSIAGSTGDHGPARSATLDRPTALTLNGNGDLLIADSGRHRIRRIEAASGVITTVAGEGTQGYAGDSGSAALAVLDSPQGLAADDGGNLYLADTHNQRIRRIDIATGTISTMAGTGAFGYAGDSGEATSAKLALPHGLTLDAQGNIFFTDSSNHRVRRIDAVTGTITTVAGDGDQGFSGDGGVSTAASLNEARAVAISSGAFTIADAANQRIRQVSNGVIQTVVGPGATIPVTLSLNGDASVPYGFGRITAMLASGTSASGSISFFDGSAMLTTVPLASNVAILDTSAFAAGQHILTASYTGDATHPAAQSTPFTLTVTPLSVAVMILPASLSYGEAIPSIAGSLMGLLPRDQPNVSATFTVDAPALPVVGSYTVKTVLHGSAAGNYTVAALPVLTITKARTAMILTAATAGLNFATAVDVGQPVLFTAHVTSATTGSPTGTMSIYDGGDLLSAGRPDSSGNLTFTTSALSSGPHTLSATYSGDSNFNSSTSPAMLFTVNPSSPVFSGDFTMAPNGSTTQTIIDGRSASFSFSVQVLGNIASPIMLSASGLPETVIASFNPSAIVPGSSSASFTMTVATQKSVAVYQKTRSALFTLLILPFSLFEWKRKRPISVRVLVTIFLALPVMLTGCGDRIRSGGPAPPTAKTYAITVTGTAVDLARGQISHTATVTLTVQPQP